MFALCLDSTQELLSRRRGTKPYLGRFCEASIVVMRYEALDLESSGLETRESRGDAGSYRSKAKRCTDATKTKTL
jgi:hypothetical protein